MAENPASPLSAPVNIGEVQQWYERDDKIVHNSALRSVMNLMIDRKIRTEFQNDSYLDALILSEIMLNRSTKCVRMLTGGCDFFLHTLQASFTKAFERLQAGGGRARILVVGNQIPPFLADSTKKFERTVEVAMRTAAPNAQIEHFLVCDTLMARVEMPHNPLKAETPIDAIKAKVAFNEPSRAKFYEDRFDVIWGLVNPSTTPVQQEAAVA